MGILHNISALSAYRNGKIGSNNASKNMEKLSSGLKINRAADDAAGLAISTKMRSIKRETQRCQINIEQGIDAAKTADGALNEINSMIIRCQELTISANTDVYTEEDKKKVELEIKELFKEINNMTKDTQYNKINLLRFDGTNDMGFPILGYEYIEEVIESQELVEWGLSNVVQSPSQIFDLSDPPENASVTFSFDPSVDLNDATTLHGKSFSIRGTRYNFTTDPNLVFPSGYNFTIKQGETVEQYLKGLIDTSSAFRSVLSDVSVNEETGEITLYAKTGNLNYTVNDVEFNVPDGSGSMYNGFDVSSSEVDSLYQVNGDIGAVDKTSDINKSATAEAEFKLTLKNQYNAADIASLIGNTINVAGASPAISIGFTTTGESGKIQVSDGMSGSDLANAILDKLQEKGLTVSSSSLTQSSSGSSTLTINGSVKVAGGSWPSVYFYEGTSSTSGSTITIPGMSGITTSKTQTSNSEQAEKWEITLPDPPTYPSSLYIGDNYRYRITLYDSSDVPPGHSYSVGGSFTYDVNGKSEDDIKSWLYSTALTAANYAYGNDANITMTGNKINLNFKAANTSYTVSAYGSNTSFTPYIPGKYELTSGGSTYFDRDMSLPMPLAVDENGDLDLDKLTGTGFTLWGYLFEFYDGGSKVNSSSTGIDISKCKNIDDVALAMQNAIAGRFTSYTKSVSVQADSKGQVTIKMTRSTSTTSPTYISGNWQYDGLFTSRDDGYEIKYFSGGTDVTKPSTTVDFSSINEDNIDDLLGTGFRIACASCENEFVNILFRWDNDTEPVPPNFTLPPPDDNVVIHNYVVELSKISDPADIVKNIVEQLEPVMTHFSGVRIDPDNPSILIVEDKRYGDLPNDQRGSLIPGLFSNFTYTVRKEVILGEVPEDLEYDDLMILVSSAGTIKENFISVHLPNLSLATLHLYPPEYSIQTPEDAAKWLQRLDDAGTVISTARGTLGADINRLQSAHNSVSNYEVNVSSSVSLIMDADIAKQTVGLSKNEILTQASQAMLAQANQSTSSVMYLLRQT